MTERGVEILLQLWLSLSCSCIKFALFIWNSVYSTNTLDTCPPGEQTPAPSWDNHPYCRSALCSGVSFLVLMELGCVSITRLVPVNLFVSQFKVSFFFFFLQEACSWVLLFYLIWQSWPLPGDGHVKLTTHQDSWVNVTIWLLVSICPLSFVTLFLFLFSFQVSILSVFLAYLQRLFALLLVISGLSADIFSLLLCASGDAAPLHTRGLPAPLWLPSPCIPVPCLCVHTRYQSIDALCALNSRLSFSKI